MQGPLQVFDPTEQAGCVQATDPHHCQIRSQGHAPTLGWFNTGPAPSASLATSLREPHRGESLVSSEDPT